MAAERFAVFSTINRHRDRRTQCVWGGRQTSSIDPPTFTSDFKSWSDAAANLAQIAAILVGGWWAYTKFIRTREEWPRASVDQLVTTRALDKKHVLVHLTMTIRNTGTVLLRLKEVRAFLHQVVPVDSETSEAIAKGSLIAKDTGEANWPTCLEAYQIPLDPEDVRIEPGESDQQRFDFLVPVDTETVFVYTYVQNAAESQRELGWQLGQFYDLERDPSEGHSSVESLTGKAATR